jgi:hypothetical protein
MIQVKKLLFKKALSVESSQEQTKMQSDLLHKECFDLEIE